MSVGRERSADEVFCRSCGERLSVRAEVCPHCGVRNDRYESRSTTDWSGDLAAGDTGLDANVAGALAYVLTFVSGIVMYVLEDDEFVRFHAAQSIVTFGGLAVASSVVTAMFAGIGLGSLAALLGSLLSLVTIGLWVFLIVTAYRGETRRVPVAADIVDRLVSGSDSTDRTGRAAGSKRETATEDDALAELRSRYARGEIGDVEFERRLEHLLETDEDRTRKRESAETERSW